MAQQQLSLWGEKLSWKLNGDLTDTGELAVRIRGKHYVVPLVVHTDAGFNGQRSQYDIEFIDGPHQGLRMTTHLIAQGAIEQDYKDLLPDNAICHPTPTKE